MSGPTKAALAAKLNPDVLAVSPRFTAMLAYFLDEYWADPRIVDMAVTSDGMLLLGTVKDPLLNEFVGDADMLDHNLKGVAQAVDLTPEETEALLTFARAKITDWRDKAWSQHR